MLALRNPTNRPGVVVDPHGFAVIQSPGPFGRERVVSTLPMEPAQLVLPSLAIVDPHGFYLGDADGNLVGEPGLFVGRMLAATTTEDTRRLG